MATDQPEQPVRDPMGELERALIADFIRAQGHDPLKLAELPEAEREALLTAASTYASAKLTEVESRAHFIHEMHDGKIGQ